MLWDEDILGKVCVDVCLYEDRDVWVSFIDCVLKEVVVCELNVERVLVFVLYGAWVLVCVDVVVYVGRDVCLPVCSSIEAAQIK